MSSYGERLMRARKEKELTREELGKLCGLFRIMSWVMSRLIALTFLNGLLMFWTYRSTI